MVQTHSTAHQDKASKQGKLPTWDCESGSLPPSQDLAHSNAGEVESQRSSSPVEESEGPLSIEEISVSNHQLQNASSPQWKPWQDHFLPSEALNLRPFLEHRRDTQHAWDCLANVLRKDSKRTGVEINRTGSACRHRFYKIIDAHWKSEMKSLQKTGTEEEVDEHIKNITKLVSLIDAHDDAKLHKASTEKQQKSTEQQAALDLWKSSMMGMVNCNTLSDVSELEDAAIREQQGQRKVYFTTLFNEQCSHGHSCLQQMPEKHQDEDEKLLQEVRAQEDEWQKEIVGGLDKLTGSITALADLHKAQMEQEVQRQMKERNRESQMFELMKVFAQQKNNWCTF
ncbi:hypothetical protein M422DRAFT_274704 [Sphaerobolus stellatus SS14]|uniref:Myb-like domain-containing protein n=1 Tax=Sphaerobolus stellatus (strain SS14) TaxID=990650 RepID=A0A0C9TRL3_SPHS4|nr:hypothetical protein M422DRAFT_274704 [Sphaerobolus stellatus SS14]